MNDEQEQTCVTAAVIFRLAWTIGEKSAREGIVAEHELVELHRLIRMALNVPDDHVLDIDP